MAPLIKIGHRAPSVADAIRFCSRCGEPAEEPPRADSPMARTRVCQVCGMGVLLSCARAALPGARAAFLIATVDGRVSAISEAAEVIFGAEQLVLGTRLTALVTSPMGDDRLTRLVTRAATRPAQPEVIPVRGLTTNAGAVGTMAARISTCGRPRAALITVEPSGFGRR